MECLRVNSIEASAHGKTLCLKCQYALDKTERLSAIEWLRNGRPFYYYTEGINSLSGDKPLDLHYSDDGFEVDVCKSIQFYTSFIRKSFLLKLKKNIL